MSLAEHMKLVSLRYGAIRATANLYARPPRRSSNSWGVLGRQEGEQFHLQYVDCVPGFGTCSGMQQGTGGGPEQGVGVAGFSHVPGSLQTVQ